MRKAILAVLAASGLAHSAPRLPKRSVPDIRSAFRERVSGAELLHFTSYEQCQATASGRFLSASPTLLHQRERTAAAAYRPLPGRVRCRPPPATADTERPRGIAPVPRPADIHART